jgi:hypothetical protein
VIVPTRPMNATRFPVALTRQSAIRLTEATG